MLVYRMDVAASDRKGATESNFVLIEAIDAWEALGYRSRGCEEHSGEPLTPASQDLLDELADNRPAQVV